MKLHVAVTTCNRKRALRACLDSIEEATRRWVTRSHGEVTVTVHNDGSPLSAKIRRRTACTVAHEKGPHGKANFWQFMNSVIQRTHRQHSDFDLYLQDDVTLAPDAFRRIHRTALCLSNVHYPWAVLDVCNPAPEPGAVARWTGELVASMPCCCRDTTWFDLQAWVANRHFYRVVPELWPVPKQRWLRDPTLSSGVGKQLSVRLCNAGLQAVQLIEPAAFHDDSLPSRLNTHKNQ